VTAGPDLVTVLLATATVAEAVALVMILAFGEDFLHRFLIRPRPKITGWEIKKYVVKSHQRTDNFRKPLEPTTDLYRALLVFFVVSNEGRFTGLGLNPRMTITLEEGDFQLAPITSEYGNELHLQNWGQSNSPMPIEIQTPEHYVMRAFDIMPVPELKKQSKFIGFNSVEGFGTIRIGIGNVLITRKTGEEFTVKVCLDTKGEAGTLVSSKPKSYRVLFQSWDKPTLIEVKN
jgi:hypothetical protein